MMRFILIGGAMLSCWLGIAAAAMLPGTIPTAMVPATTNLPDTVAILDRRGPVIIVYSDDKSYVRSLYAQGARFVLPARKSTCVDLQS